MRFIRVVNCPPTPELPFGLAGNPTHHRGTIHLMQYEISWYAYSPAAPLRIDVNGGTRYANDVFEEHEDAGRVPTVEYEDLVRGFYEETNTSENQGLFPQLRLHRWADSFQMSCLQRIGEFVRRNDREQRSEMGVSQSELRRARQASDREAITIDDLRAAQQAASEEARAAMRESMRAFEASIQRPPSSGRTSTETWNSVSYPSSFTWASPSSENTEQS